MRLSWGVPLTVSTDTTRDIAVGTLRFEPDGRVYRWVQNLHTATLTRGQIAHTVVTDNTRGTVARLGAANTNSVFPAGTVQATDGIPQNWFGWLMVRGVDAATQVEGTTAISVGHILQGTASQSYLVRAGTGTAAPVGLYAIANAAYSTAAAGAISCSLHML